MWSDLIAFVPYRWHENTLRIRTRKARFKNAIREPKLYFERVFRAKRFFKPQRSSMRIC
jgi:hypothetical protein